jgi:hypothetical protein
VEDAPKEDITESEPKNALCPGATRPNGQVKLKMSLFHIFLTRAVPCMCVI